MSAFVVAVQPKNGDTPPSPGSVAVRDVVTHRRLALVVCVYSHAYAGQSVVREESPIVNVGPGGNEWALDRVGSSERP